MKITLADCKHIWNAIEKFTRYGFNRAHSVCYALIGYQCLFLKVNYPVEFFCSILNFSDKEKTLIYIKDALRYKIKVLPVDINKSGLKFKPLKSGNILYPINHLKYIGKCSQTIIDNRPYDNFDDFLGKIKGKRINKNAVISLIRAGAFDKFEPRDKLFYKFSKHIAKKKVKDLVKFKAWDTMETLEQETLAYEFEFSESLLEELFIKLKDEHECMGIKRALEEGGVQKIGGLVRKIKEHKTAKGTMAFIDFSYFNKNSSLSIFHDKWNIYSKRIKIGSLFAGTAMVSDYNGRKNFVLSTRDRCRIEVLNQKEQDQD